MTGPLSNIYIFKHETGIIEGNTFILENGLSRIKLDTMSMKPKDQPILTRKVNDIVSVMSKGPGYKCQNPCEQLYYFIHKSEVKIARAYWIPNKMVQNAMHHSKLLIEYFNKNMTKCHKWNKRSANGSCIEFGVGGGPGMQSTSMRINNISSHLPYIRNEDELNAVLSAFCDQIESDIASVFETSFSSLRKDVLLEGYKGLNSTGRVILSGIIQCKKGFPYAQRAVRLCGCPSILSKSNWMKRMSAKGGSTLHHDKCDCKHRNGQMIIYLNPYEKEFKGFDLSIFHTTQGGRSVTIPTMKKGWVCLTVFDSSAHLHGSVFPDHFTSSECFSKEGNQAVRIVLYTLASTVKFASHLSQDIEGNMKEWKECISRLEEKFRWRHCKVYNSVVTALNEKMRCNLKKI